MDWIALQKKMARDADLPARANRLMALQAVLAGRQYECLKHSFVDETNGAGEYIPLSHRRPSVPTNLCRVVVDDAASLLFSEGHFPGVHAADPRTLDAIAALIKDRRLNEVMLDAATRGSVGSVALWFRVLRNKPFISVIDTAFLTPDYDPEDPDSLVRVTERYKVKGADLRARGYQIAGEDKADFWFQREWTADEEVWFQPLLVADAKEGKAAVRDETKSLKHGLGFLPLIWIRNLTGGDEIDGACTFESAISTSIEIDYQISQAGRGLKYASDPKLVVRDPGGQDQPLTGGAANRLTLFDPTSEAKFLEINGTAATTVREHVEFLRTVALESVHGNRADPSKLAAAQSGRAMELMCLSLVFLADRLRTSYGEGALLSLCRMICQASKAVTGGLLIGGQRYSNLSPEGLALRWPDWFAPTAMDKQVMATGLSTLVARGILSEETATRAVSGVYDIEDVVAERDLVNAERKAADERLAQQPAVQTKVAETLAT